MKFFIRPVKVNYNNMEFSKIPKEIISLILLYLPIKIKYYLVAKIWYLAFLDMIKIYPVKLKYVGKITNILPGQNITISWPEGINLMSSDFTFTKKIELYGLFNFPETEKAILARLINLEELTVFCNKNSSVNILEKFNNHHGLKKVSLSSIFDDIILPVMKNLIYLKLEDCKKKIDLTNLKYMPKLETLSVFNCRNIFGFNREQNQIKKINILNSYFENESRLG